MPKSFLDGVGEYMRSLKRVRLRYESEPQHIHAAVISANGENSVRQRAEQHVKLQDGDELSGETDEDSEEAKVLVVTRRAGRPHPCSTPLGESNREILASKAKKEGRNGARSRFFNSHADVLNPFLDPKIPRLVQGEQLDMPLLTQPQHIIPPGAMRDYQLESLAFFVHAFEHGVGVILGDEMGLGKTLQTIALFAHLKFKCKISGPYLVVCPLSVLEGWSTELQRWCPALKVLKIHTNEIEEQQRLKQRMRCLDWDVAITTYDVVKNKGWKASFHQIVWRVVAADEGQVVKNAKADVTRALHSLRAEFKIMLTGTPVQNNLAELHTLVDFVCPGMFSERRFLEAYDAQSRSTDSRALVETRRLLELLMLRRLKADVEKGLPPKYEVRVNCPLSPMQLFWYRRLLVKDLAILMKVEQEEGYAIGHCKKLMSLVVQLRKAANHPYLFPDAEDAADGSLAAMVAASGKLALLDRLLVGLRSRGHRIVVFSQYTRMMNIIEDYLKGRGWQYLRLDGSTSRVLRVVRIHKFQHGEYSVFLSSTRAGGLGINLHSSDTVVLFDSDWNPQADTQAMARVHRVGQTKPVWIYRLVAAGTVEERILQRAESKLALDHAVLADDSPEDDQQLDAHSLFTILRTSVHGVSTRALSDAELNKLLDRSQIPAAPLKVEPKGELHDVFTVLGQQVPKKPALSMRGIQLEWANSNPVHVVDKRPEVTRVFSSQSYVRAVVKDRFCLACKRSDHQQKLFGCSNHTCHVALCNDCLHTQPIQYTNSSGGTSWHCPQHRCALCSAKADQVGGTLLRCTGGCPRAWCVTCVPGGLSSFRIADPEDEIRKHGRIPPGSSLPIVCGECQRGAEKYRAHPEPSTPLDLKGFVCVGDVDKAFGFLARASKARVAAV